MTALQIRRGLVVAVWVPMSKLSEVRTPLSSLTGAAALVLSALGLRHRSTQRGRPSDNPTDTAATGNRVCSIRTAALIGAALVGLLGVTGGAYASSGCTSLASGSQGVGTGGGTLATGTGFDAGNIINASVNLGNDPFDNDWVALTDTTTGTQLEFSYISFSYAVPTDTTDTFSLSFASAQSTTITWSCQNGATPPLTLTSTPSSTTQLGQPYSQTNVAGGGTAPFTYSVSAGTLPAGTTLNTSTGLVSGTPTTAAAFSYTIKVTDSTTPTAQTASNVVSGTIAPATLTLASTGSSTTQVGQPYSQTNVASGGTPSFTYSVFSGTLPAGTTLNTSTGLVSGTPTTTGAFSYAIKVTDSGNPVQTATQTTSGTIVPALIMTSTAAATAQLGKFYRQTNVASGGTTPYTYSVSAGALPAGTSLNASNGTVSGTTTATGAFSYTIEATDSTTPIAQTTTQTTSGAIVTTLTLVATASSTTRVGQSYSQTNVASGGTTPYTYSVSVGILPAGTALNASTGLVSGTPTTAGAFSYAIAVTDSSSPAQTATQDTSGTIAPSTLTLVATASSTTQLSQFYRQTNVASGGIAPYTYSVSAGSLPAGTSLNASTGVVYGTPTAAVAFNYTIKATDSTTPTAQTATQTSSGTIASGAIAPTVSAVSPNGGPPAGGTTVTITGTNLTGATGVNFGGHAAAQFIVNSATTISAIAPAGSIGAVDVTVITGNGTSAANAADRFTYASPRLAQVASKVTGAGASGAADLGNAVSLSSDGNTALVGGYNDNTGVGAVWIFSHSSGSWKQVGGKLVGSGNIGAANEGWSVALSGDGNTAIVGGNADHSGIGAAWVFTQSGGVWTQQAELTASGETGAGQFGIAVALSSNGSTALIGGNADSSSNGAVWVFTRSGNSWTQSGSKLTPSDETGAGLFGSAVALSSSATTAIIGGSGDSTGTGAAWVFTQSGGVWSQQGLKLLGTGAIGAAAQGYSVALAADGNTAIVGGYHDNTDAGAAWVFTQSGNVWTQAGSKLVGTGAAGNARQGFSVALSADASTAALGGYEDNASNGAVWLFTQSGGTWTQKGSKLTGSGNTGAAAQGTAVALSSNGRTMLEGGPADNSNAGAVWVFVADKLADSHDFNADSYSDILWRDTSGDLSLWLMNGPSIAQGIGFGAVPTSWTVVGSRDFNGDGSADILWRASDGTVSMWLMSGGQFLQSTNLGLIPTAWSVAGTGDFNGDGKGDILWRDTSGDTTIWFMNGGTITSADSLGNVPTIWSVAGTGDFNGDGTTDILWHDIYGDVSLWLINNGNIQQGLSLGNVPTNWTIAGTGDFNGDGTSDIVWRNTSGDIWIWLMNGNGTILQSSVIGNMPTTWSITETGDFNSDGKSDVLWIDTSGNVVLWFMNGMAVTSAASLGNVGTPWSVQGANAD